MLPEDALFTHDLRCEIVRIRFAHAIRAGKEGSELMKTEWDYTELADAYLKRAPYSDDALSELLAAAGVSAGGKICDVGAGTAKLTLPLAERGYSINAVEPNDAMRANGIKLTAALKNVQWS